MTKFLSATAKKRFPIGPAISETKKTIVKLSKNNMSINKTWKDGMFAFENHYEINNT